MICAGYCAYGSATELVLTYGRGVQRFTLGMQICAKCECYGVAIYMCACTDRKSDSTGASTSPHLTLPPSLSLLPP